MSLTVEPTKLCIASIFTQTQTKHFILYNTLIKHRLINCFQRTWSISATSWCQAKNSICNLAVEKLCFSFNTTEIEIEIIQIQMIIFTKINLVVHNVPFIRTSLSIKLCELALVVIDTCALIYFILTRINVKCVRICDVKPLV